MEHPDNFTVNKCSCGPYGSDGQMFVLKQDADPGTGLQGVKVRVLAHWEDIWKMINQRAENGASTYFGPCDMFVERTHRVTQMQLEKEARTIHLLHVGEFIMCSHSEAGKRFNDATDLQYTIVTFSNAHSPVINNLLSFAYFFPFWVNGFNSAKLSAPHSSREPLALSDLSEGRVRFTTSGVATAGGGGSGGASGHVFTLPPLPPLVPAGWLPILPGAGARARATASIGAGRSDLWYIGHEIVGEIGALTIVDSDELGEDATLPLLYILAPSKTHRVTSIKGFTFSSYTWNGIKQLNFATDELVNINEKGEAFIRIPEGVYTDFDLFGCYDSMVERPIFAKKVFEGVPRVNGLFVPPPKLYVANEVFHTAEVSIKMEQLSSLRLVVPRVFPRYEGWEGWNIIYNLFRNPEDHIDDRALFGKKFVKCDEIGDLPHVLPDSSAEQLGYMKSEEINLYDPLSESRHIRPISLFSDSPGSNVFTFKVRVLVLNATGTCIAQSLPSPVYTITVDAKS